MDKIVTYSILTLMILSITFLTVVITLFLLNRDCSLGQETLIPLIICTCLIQILGAFVLYLYDVIGKSEGLKRILENSEIVTKSDSGYLLGVTLLSLWMFYYLLRKD